MKSLLLYFGENDQRARGSFHIWHPANFRLGLLNAIQSQVELRKKEPGEFIPTRSLFIELNECLLSLMFDQIIL